MDSDDSATPRRSMRSRADVDYAALNAGRSPARRNTTIEKVFSEYSERSSTASSPRRSRISSLSNLAAASQTLPGTTSVGMATAWNSARNEAARNESARLKEKEIEEEEFLQTSVPQTPPRATSSSSSSGWLSNVLSRTPLATLSNNSTSSQDFISESTPKPQNSPNSFRYTNFFSSYMPPSTSSPATTPRAHKRLVGKSRLSQIAHSADEVEVELDERSILFGSRHAIPDFYAEESVLMEPHFSNTVLDRLAQNYFLKKSIPVVLAATNGILFAASAIVSFLYFMAGKPLGISVWILWRIVCGAVAFISFGISSWRKVWLFAAFVFLGAYIVGNKLQDDPLQMRNVPPMESSPQNLMRTNLTQMVGSIFSSKSPSRKEESVSAKNKFQDSELRNLERRIARLEEFVSASDKTHFEFKSQIDSAHNNLCKESAQMRELLKQVSSAHEKSESATSSFLKNLESDMKKMRKEVSGIEQRQESSFSNLKLFSDKISALEKEFVQFKERQDAFADSVAKIVSESTQQLPQMVVAQKMENGELQLPHEFWMALESRIGKLRNFESEWETFLDKNSVRIAAIAAEQIDLRIPQIVLTRTETISLVEQKLKNAISDLDEIVAQKTKMISNPVQETPQEAIEEIARQVVAKEIAKLRADVLAVPDFALEAAGARIILNLTSATFSPPFGNPSVEFISRLVGLRKLRGKPPTAALRPGVSAGDCWPMAGRSGSLGILLAAPATVSAIVVEHLPQEVSLSGWRKSAPRQMELWAVLNATEFHKLDLSNEKLKRGEVVSSAGAFLHEFEFDPDAGSLQVFPLRNKLRTAAVFVRILSNWGNDQWTCLYRIRIHGNE